MSISPPMNLIKPSYMLQRPPSHNTSQSPPYTMKRIYFHTLKKFSVCLKHTSKDFLPTHIKNTFYTPLNPFIYTLGTCPAHFIEKTLKYSECPPYIPQRVTLKNAREMLIQTSECSCYIPQQTLPTHLRQTSIFNKNSSYSPPSDLPTNLRDSIYYPTRNLPLQGVLLAYIRWTSVFISQGHQYTTEIALLHGQKPFFTPHTYLLHT